jgi:hypothetical protein
MQSLKEKIKSVLDGLPEEPRARLDAIADIYSTMRTQVARELHPSITTLLRESPSLTYAEKAELSHRINEVLQDARLAIINPKTEMPATLISNRPRPSSQVSRLYLRDCREGTDGRRHTLLLNKLPNLHIELVSTVSHSVQSHNTKPLPSQSR